jgi:hypothetical protein
MIPQLTGVVDAINLASAVTATVGSGVGYLQIAKRRLWWPFNPRLPAPLKLELKRLLAGATAINPSTHVEVTLKELDGDHVWLEVLFRQSTKNLAKRVWPLRSHFTTNGRRYRSVIAQLDNKPVAPRAENEAEILVSANLEPLQTKTVELRYEMSYYQVDSDLFVSYLAGETYSFSIVDAVSEAAGRRLFVLDIDPLINTERFGSAEILNVPGRPYSRQFGISEGFSPFTGVYLRWRKLP